MSKQLVLGLAIATSIILLTALYIFEASPPSNFRLHGSLFANDAGRSHGGFVYSAEWNATLLLEGSNGTLMLVLNSGLSDALQRHVYHVTDFILDSEKISMKIDSQTVVLVWVDNDTVWNHAYDKYYIASWGSDASPEEIRGIISPSIFKGLAENYYVELRLR